MSLAVRLRRSSPLRKSFDAVRQVPRAVRRWTARPADYERAPPVLANSFPKSGTHLLLRIVESFPDVRFYGAFLASMPSLTFRERTVAAHLRRIGRIAPGEALPAHLFHDERYALALAERRIVHFFIHRDPRDVAVSEAHYLTHMNRWHRMHPWFRRLPDMASRIELSIRGATDPDVPYDYPDIAARFGRYRGWLDREDVFPVRYEDLMSDRRERTVNGMIEFFAARGGRVGDRPVALAAALAGFDPLRSHTFREGGTGGWREAFPGPLRTAMKEVAGDLLVELGYEADHDW